MRPGMGVVKENDSNACIQNIALKKSPSLTRTFNCSEQYQLHSMYLLFGKCCFGIYSFDKHTPCHVGNRQPFRKDQNGHT